MIKENPEMEIVLINSKFKERVNWSWNVLHIKDVELIQAVFFNRFFLTYFIYLFNFNKFYYFLYKMSFCDNTMKKISKVIPSVIAFI